MLSENEIKSLVRAYGEIVNTGRTIKQIIDDKEIPELNRCAITEGKVSDSVFGENLVTGNGVPIRLMYRSKRISTHDQNRGEIPFKDQVLACNHDHMLDLIKDVLGTSQFDVPGLKPSSTVIPAENLEILKVENVLRKYMAESSTQTSLYQHWLKAQEDGMEKFTYAGHEIIVDEMEANGILPYVMDTPSTKDKEDKTIDPQYLFDNAICTSEQYTQIRNSSLMAYGIISQYLREKRMVLVDTKTEHGINSKGEIVSADELYTMDSSRFWKLNDDGTIMSRNGKPISFSKEFARGMIKEKGQIFTPEQAEEITVRYIQGLQHLTGKAFEPDLRPRDERIIDSTNLILDYLL